MNNITIKLCGLIPAQEAERLISKSYNVEVAQQNKSIILNVSKTKVSEATPDEKIMANL